MLPLQTYEKEHQSTDSNTMTTICYPKMADLCQLTSTSNYQCHSFQPKLWPTLCQYASTVDRTLHTNTMWKHTQKIQVLAKAAWRLGALLMRSRLLEKWWVTTQGSTPLALPLTCCIHTIFGMCLECFFLIDKYERHQQGCVYYFSHKLKHLHNNSFFKWLCYVI